MKTVVITGTSRGLGLSIAEKFIAAGWHVIGVGRTAPEGLANYTHYTADIANMSQVYSAFDTMRKVGTSIDLLVNNSAAFHGGSFDSVDYIDICTIVDTNVKGTMYVTMEALKSMQAGSRIVFINSVAGLREIQNQSLYCASKAALRSFAGIIGQELRDRKIKVSSIHPGGINTTLWNEQNPYPCGRAEDALDPAIVADAVFHIAEVPHTTEIKTITMFPEVEWH
jgi:NADP-dependent 3-hydroxy acid dehydrogenase YdfG